jgi:hypothetical protein
LIGALVGELYVRVRMNGYQMEDWLDDDGNSHKFDGFYGFYSGHWLAASGFISLGFFLMSLKYTDKHPRPVRGGICSSWKRFGKAAFVAGCFWGIASVGMYHNLNIDNKEGESYRFKEAWDEILDSPVWAQLSIHLADLYKTLNDMGWEEFLEKLNEMMDADGTWADSKALKVLDLPAEATQEEIKKAKRKMIKLYHPDICKLDKDVCAEKFMAVQKASEILDDDTRKRKAANKKSRKDERPRKKKKSQKQRSSA